MSYVAVLYESPHRIIKTLGQLEALTTQRQIMVARELTKKFETIYRGTVGEILAGINPKEIRGEFVIIIDRE